MSQLPRAPKYRKMLTNVRSSSFPQATISTSCPPPHSPIPFPLRSAHDSHNAQYVPPSSTHTHSAQPRSSKCIQCITPPKTQLPKPSASVPPAKTPLLTRSTLISTDKTQGPRPSERDSSNKKRILNHNQRPLARRNFASFSWGLYGAHVS